MVFAGGYAVAAYTGFTGVFLVIYDHVAGTVASDVASDVTTCR